MQNVTANSISLLQIATGQLNNRTEPSTLDHLYFSWKKRKEKSQLRFISVQFFLHLKESSTPCDFAACLKSLSLHTSSGWQHCALSGLGAAMSQQAALSSILFLWDLKRTMNTFFPYSYKKWQDHVICPNSLLSLFSLWPTSVQKEEEHTSMGDLSTVWLLPPPLVPRWLLINTCSWPVLALL